jgi:cysteine desulfurase / selenocysteine lyase
LKQLSEYRSEFPITENYVFFNNAAISSPPTRVTSAVCGLFNGFAHDGITRYPEWMQLADATRASFARLINAGPSEIAFTGNTSDGLNVVAAGLAWKPGDKILLTVPDFPSNVYPWMNLERLGVEVYYLQKRNGRFNTEDIEKVLRPGTRLIAASSTDFATGFRCDLAELGEFCRKRGILLCIDAIQSLGAVPLDVKESGIHFLACGGHKWLLSTMGIGELYISEEVNDLVYPARVGWRSVEREEDYYNLELKLKTDARRFETGTLNISGIAALGVAVEMLLEIGIERIFENILRVNDLLSAGLEERNLKIISPRDREDRSGILSFIPDDAGALFRYCLENNVLVAQRGDAVRLSPHFYNDESDIANFFEVLDIYLKGK